MNLTCPSCPLGYELDSVFFNFKNCNCNSLIYFSVIVNGLIIFTSLTCIIMCIYVILSVEYKKYSKQMLAMMSSIAASLSAILFASLHLCLTKPNGFFWFFVSACLCFCSYTFVMISSAFFDVVKNSLNYRKKEFVNKRVFWRRIGLHLFPLYLFVSTLSVSFAYWFAPNYSTIVTSLFPIFVASSVFFLFPIYQSAVELYKEIDNVLATSSSNNSNVQYKLIKNKIFYFLVVFILIASLSVFFMAIMATFMFIQNGNLAWMMYPCVICVPISSTLSIVVMFYKKKPRLQISKNTLAQSNL